MQTLHGLEYTRNGSFHRSWDGRLCSADGGLVLSTHGPIVLPESGAWIDDQGRLGGGGQLRVARPLDPQSIYEVQSGRFLTQAEDTQDYRVRSGFLEQANFDPRSEELALQRVTLLLDSLREISL